MRARWPLRAWRIMATSCRSMFGVYGFQTRTLLTAPQGPKCLTSSLLGQIQIERATSDQRRSSRVPTAEHQPCRQQNGGLRTRASQIRQQLHGIPLKEPRRNGHPVVDDEPTS
jgi:hypothetical protein